MHAMVTARVPLEIRDQVNAKLRSIGSSPTELVNAAYDYVLATGELPEAVLKAMAQPVRRCEDLILDGMNLIWLKNQK